MQQINCVMEIIFPKFADIFGYFGYHQFEKSSKITFWHPSPFSLQYHRKTVDSENPRKRVNFVYILT